MTWQKFKAFYFGHELCTTFFNGILDLPASGSLRFHCLCQRYKCTTLAHSFHLWSWTEAKWPLTFLWAIECILCECVHSIQRTSTAKHFEPTVVSKISGSQNHQAFGTKALFPSSESASRGAIKQTKVPGWSHRDRKSAINCWRQTTLQNLSTIKTEQNKVQVPTMRSTCLHWYFPSFQQRLLTISVCMQFAFCCKAYLSINIVQKIIFCTRYASTYFV